MLTNDQMVENRFARWAKSRRVLREILGMIDRGRVVEISTYSKSWRYDVRHKDLFKATQQGVFVLQGKTWNCIDFCCITYCNP